LRDKDVFDTHVLACATPAPPKRAVPGQIEEGWSRETRPTIRPQFVVHSGDPGFARPFVTVGSDSAMNSTMDGFQLNKILGLVLGTLLVLQTVRIVDGMFLPAKEHSRVAVAEAKGEAAGGAQLDNLLASASAEHGAQLAKVCQICHNVEEGQGPKIGPDLYGIVDRPVASAAGFKYSAALKAKGGKWTFAALNKWLTDPRGDVPGTSMTFVGVSSEKQRADLIAYLDTLSKNPVPLPKAQ
jgi:cytochrome c